MSNLLLPLDAARVATAQGFVYYPNFLESSHAGRLLELFWSELQWQHQTIHLYGQPFKQPRLSCWYGDPGTHYSYSGLNLDPLPWHRRLLDLKSQLENELQTSFNSMLANAYRDGSDSMGWHTDDEEELGSQPVIASISLGECRRFLIRPNNGRASIRMDLDHGSLLVMQGNSQREYKHALPKSRRMMNLRINLTYRMVRINSNKYN